jgi:magnesium chelatase subunit I
MEIRLKISQVCAELDVDGLRGDLVTTRASRAAAAYRGAKIVTDEDVYSVISLCLRHRLRKDPMATIDEGSRVYEVFSSVFGYEVE